MTQNFLINHFKVDIFVVDNDINTDDDVNNLSSPSSDNPEPAAAQTVTVSNKASSYDFVLKFLLVGDSDVGKEEILHQLENDYDEASETYRSHDVAYKSTSILLYGKRVKLHMWLGN